jgi:Fic family protein
VIFQVKTLPRDCQAVVEKIDAQRKQLRYATSDSRRRWTGFLRRSTYAKAIRSSNSIEGYHVTEDAAVAAVDADEPLDDKTESWMAVVGYRQAMTYILRLADDPHFVHNEGTLNALHYIMVGFDPKANPGRWRRGSVWIKNEASGKTVYEAPDVATVPHLIGELIEALNAKDGLPVMVKAAMAHLNLVMIHPYADGNGRMARALQTLVLAREGVLDPTFSSIEEYLGANTPDYYAVLAEVGQGAWHPERDAMPWIRFCLTAHHRQAQTLLRRSNEISRLWDVLEDELKKQKLNERLIFALSDAAMGWRVRNSGYRKHVEIGEESASKDLRALVDHGLLVPQGEKRGRVYVASERLLQLRAAARSPDVALVDPFLTLQSGSSDGDPPSKQRGG